MKYLSFQKFILYIQKDTCQFGVVFLQASLSYLNMINSIEGTLALKDIKETIL